MIRLYLATDEAHTFTASFFAVDRVGLGLGSLIEAKKKSLCSPRGAGESGGFDGRTHKKGHFAFLEAIPTVWLPSGRVVDDANVAAAAAVILNPL